MDDLTVTKITEDNKTVTIGWVPPAWQEGYLPMIDGSDRLTDGKRHPGTSETQAQVRIGKPADETNPATKHRYGVAILGPIAAGNWPAAVTPPDPPPGPTVETITKAQFDALVRAGATIRDKKIVNPDGTLADIGWGVSNVTLANCEFSGVYLVAGSSGARLLSVKARRFVCDGTSDWEVAEGSLFDGKGVTADCILRGYNGVVGSNWAVRDTTFKNFFTPNMAPGPNQDHCQCIFIGSSHNGVVERCNFSDSGNSALLFVSSWGYNASAIPDVKIRNNVFGQTWAYFSVNVHVDEIPITAPVCVQAGQPTVKALCSRDGFVKAACP